MRTLIKNANIVNEGQLLQGHLAIENGCITLITNHIQPEASYDEVIDASGCYVLPGVIDDHVHFREPGLTQKADMESESRAAAAGGVTTYMDMPNTIPQTTSLEAWEEKRRIASEKSHVNYAFFFGATNDNANLFPLIDIHHTPGIKLFMGSSTGNMLVDRREALEHIFATAPLPVMTHCEDTTIINENMRKAKSLYGDDPDVMHHYEIRSEEACWLSTLLAVQLAEKYDTQLHVAHISTARELQLFGNHPRITAEAVIGHLLFTKDDHRRAIADGMKPLGSLIKVNPSIKTASDRDELRKALTDGRITTIGTDHAPHQLKDKQGGAAKAASGMPMIQFSLPAMLDLTDEGVLSMERMVKLMCHNPARLFGMNNRGYIREGYHADLTIVKREPWVLEEHTIESKCGWSPMTGHQFGWKVVRTICNGHTVWDGKTVDRNYIGEEASFR